MNVFIIGSAGNIGKKVVKQLSDLGQNPMAMHRHAEQATELETLGALAIQADLVKSTVEELANYMMGANAVVFTAGAGGKGIELTNQVDGEGLVKAVQAAQMIGIKRFVLVSVFPEAGRDRETTDSFKNYMKVKKQADVFLVASKLDWVIIRPGTLTHETGTGLVNANLAINYGSVSRDDVATTLVQVLQTPSLSQKIIELTEGNTSITQALNNLSE
jgi:uncharacterized protein YbjT (DUF2867 family)